MAARLESQAHALIGAYALANNGARRMREMRASQRVREGEMRKQK